MLSSARRTFYFLLRTPLLPPAPPAPAFELSTIAPITSTAGPSRPSATRTFSTFSAVSLREPGYVMDGVGQRRHASDKGQKELYSDESGSVGAGIDDVAHTDAAFDKNADPHSSAKKIEKETGKDFTKHSPARSDYSKPQGKQGKPGTENPPLNTSQKKK